MDALTEARETNKRLNRRLGSVENDLHSMVSLAQQEARVAQRELGQAQASNQHWVKWNGDLSTRCAHQKERIVSLQMYLFLVSLWAVSATAALLWLAVR